MPRLLPAFLSAALALVLLAVVSASASAATPAYPDLKTQSPRDLRFAQVDFDQVVTDSGGTGVHNVLQFSNSVYNAGESQLVVRGDIDPGTRRGTAYQRIFDTDGNFLREQEAGDFYWHESHRHYHYEQWGVFQLWTKADYDEWLRTGATGPEVQTGMKTTSCILDEEFWATLPGTRADPTYELSGCYPPNGSDLLEGLSVGWSDTYDWYRPDQWIDLGDKNLANGDYVLRSVSDPDNQIQESDSGTVGGDPDRESRSSNAAIRAFKVQNGQIVDSDKPSGTVTLNGVDRTTDSPAVDLAAIGRDDVSGVNKIRISNNNATWQVRDFTDWGSTPNKIPWNLADTSYGGNAQFGAKTVYVQFQDKTGKWSDSVTDVIELVPSSTMSPYTNTVRADGASTHLRFDEAAGAARPREEISRNDGWYIGSPTLGAATLLGSDGERSGLRFDGDDHVYVPAPGGLGATGQITLESWVKADSLPGGTVRTILAKPGVYALRTTGLNLEFSATTTGGTQVVSGPAATLQQGQTYHVAATFDGSMMRLYVNGVLKESRPHTGTLAVGGGGGDLYVGAPYDAAGGRWVGTLDEPAVYATALTPAKLQSHFDTGRTRQQAPAMPTGLTAAAQSPTRVRLTWTDNADNENAHLIERATNASFAGAETLQTSQDETSFVDLGRQPNTTYYYRIRARNSAGLSEWATPSSTTTSEAPTAATNNANPVGQSTATLNGQVDANGSGTKYFFEYGTSTAYGSRVPAAAAGDADAGSGTAPVNVSQALTGLQPGTTYHYRLVAKGDGVVVNGSSASFTTLAVPAGLAATPASATRIDVAWNDVTGETGYELQRSSSSSFTSPQTYTLGAGVTSQADNGLAGGTTYYYRVRSVRGSEVSGWSPTRPAATLNLPVAQTNAAADAAVGGARLNGRVDPRGSATTYWWEYGTVGSYGSKTPDRGPVSGAADVSEVVAGLAPSTTYNFRLAARSAAGTTTGSGLTFTTLPAAPSGVATTANGSTAITVTWGDASPDETGFEIQRDTTSGFSSPTTLAPTSPNTTSLSDSGLLPNAAYHYRVRALRGGEASAWSAPVSRTTGHATPGATTGNAPATGQTTATVTGTVDPKGSDTTYKFEYGLTDQYGSATASKSAGTGRGDFAGTADLTGLEPGRTYHYRIVATSPGGTTTGGDRTFPTAVPPAPATPTGVSATPASGSQINLAWTDASTNETGFDIQRSTSADFSNPSTSTAAANATSATLTGLANDTTYYVRVQARHAFSASNWATASATTHGAPVVTAGSPADITMTAVKLSGTIDPKGAAVTYKFEYGTTTAYGGSTTAKTTGSTRGAVPVSEQITGLQPDTLYQWRLTATNSVAPREVTGTFRTAVVPAPTAPSNLTAEPISPTLVRLAWTDNSSNETRFEIDRDGTALTPNPAANVTTRDDSGAQPNATYVYRVRAVGAGGPSAWATKSVTTPAVAPAATTAEATGVGMDAASLAGSVDPRGAATVYWFEYGKTESYGQKTPETSAGSGRTPQTAAAALSGLEPGTKYFFRLVARNAGGTTGGAVTSFQTAAAPKPDADTGDATGIARDSATVAAIVDPNGWATSYWFELGTTEAYGRSSDPSPAGSGADPETVTAAFTGLAPGTLYYYRVVAQGPGGISLGADRSFTTQPEQAEQPAQPQPQPQQPQQPQGDGNPTLPPPGPGPAPGPAPLPDPPKDVKPPRAALTIPVQSLSTALGRGVSFKLKVNEPGRASTRALVSPSALGRRSRQVELVVGRSDKRMTKAGTFTVRIKLSSTARRLLKRRRTVKLWVETTVTDTAGNRTRPVRSAVVLRARPAAARR